MDREKVKRKRRTREHVIADLSVNHVARMVLRAGFVAQEYQHDYGIDLEISTYDKNGEVEPGVIYIQVKATDNIPRMRHGRTISLGLDERDLRAWAMRLHPVILILYDAQRDRAYWFNIWAYARSIRPELVESMTAYRTIRIPVRNRFNEHVIVKLAEEMNKMYATSEGWI